MSSHANEQGKPKAPQVKPEQIKSFRECLDGSIKTYKRKRNWNKLGAIAVHVVTIGLTTATTITIGLKVAQDSSADYTNLALWFSALATAASSLEAVFDFRALWVGYNIAISKLKLVLARLNYLEASGLEYLDGTLVEHLYEQYEIVCSAVQKDYKDIRTSDT